MKNAHPQSLCAPNFPSKKKAFIFLIIHAFKNFLRVLWRLLSGYSAYHTSMRPTVQILRLPGISGERTCTCHSISGRWPGQVGRQSILRASWLGRLATLLSSELHWEILPPGIKCVWGLYWRWLMTSTFRLHMYKHRDTWEPTMCIPHRFVHTFIPPTQHIHGKREANHLYQPFIWRLSSSSWILLYAKHLGVDYKDP